MLRSVKGGNHIVVLFRYMRYMYRDIIGKGPEKWLGLGPRLSDDRLGMTCSDDRTDYSRNC